MTKAHLSIETIANVADIPGVDTSLSAKDRPSQVSSQEESTPNFQELYPTFGANRDDSAEYSPEESKDANSSNESKDKEDGRMGFAKLVLEQLTSGVAITSDLSDALDSANEEESKDYG